MNKVSFDKKIQSLVKLFIQMCPWFAMYLFCTAHDVFFFLAKA